MICNNDKIKLKLTRAQNDTFFLTPENGKHTCSFSLKDANGFTVYLNDNDNDQHASMLQHGSEFEFGGIWNDSNRVWSNLGRLKAILNQSIPEQPKQRWKIFIADRTLEKSARQNIINDSINCNDNIETFNQKVSQKKKGVHVQSYQEQLRDVIHQMNQTITNKNQTIADMKIWIEQIIVKLNTSENNTIRLLNELDVAKKTIVHKNQTIAELQNRTHQIIFEQNKTINDNLSNNCIN